MWKALINNPFTAIVIAVCYPFLFILGNNIHVYQMQGILFSLFAMLLLVIPMLYLGIIYYRYMKRNVKRRDVIDAISAFVAIIVMLSGFHETVLTYFGSKLVAVLMAIVIAGVCMCYVFKYGLKVLIIFMLSLTIISLLEIGFTAAADMSTKLPYATNNASHLRFKRKPNVYLFLLESFQNADALKQIYGTDDSQLNGYLVANDFNIYDNCYSNYQATLTSAYALFTQQHHYYDIFTGSDDAISGVRDVLGGTVGNPVLEAFKNNGYLLNFIHWHRYIFNRTDDIDYSNIGSGYLFPLVEYVENHAIVRIIKEYLLGQGVLTCWSDDIRKALINRMKESEHRDIPQFYFLYFGAKHSHMRHRWEDSERFSKLYVKSYKRTVDNLLAALNIILDSDPKSMIILIGDHGARRYRGIWNGEHDGDNVNEVIRQRGLEPNKVALDVAGTFLSIRWPDKRNHIEGNISHVNLFRHVFSYLADDPSLLIFDERNVSYLRKSEDELFIIARDGALLDDWELYSRK